MIIDYKGLELFGKLLFERAIIKPPFTITSQMPEAACFAYVLEGGYQAIGETANQAIRKDEAVIMKCGNYLFKTLENVSEEETHYESLAIHFDRESLKRIYDKEIPSFLKQKTQPETPGMVKIKAASLVDKYIQDLLYYFENQSLVNEDILILKMKEIILLLLQTRFAAEIKAILSDVFSHTEADFKEIIEAHIFSDLTNAELASLTNRSLTSFKREFKLIYGDSPTNYIMTRRIEAAKEKLLVSKESITEIAFECGFKDLSHFSKLFKQKVNLSPSVFRETNTGPFS